MGRLIIEIRISGKAGKSAENSVMDLMSILLLYGENNRFLFLYLYGVDLHLKMFALNM